MPEPWIRLAAETSSSSSGSSDQSPTNNDTVQNPPTQAQPRLKPPHIRLNSGVENILSMISDAGSATSSTGKGIHRRQSSFSRSLMGGIGGLTRMKSTGNGSVYRQKPPAESEELLLPPPVPRRMHRRRGQGDDRRVESPVVLTTEEAADDRAPSAASSNWTRWSSDGGSESASQADNLASLFDESRSPSLAGSDEVDINTQTVSRLYQIHPSASLLVFPEDVEGDDYLHNPDAADKDGNCDVWSTRGLVNTGGLMLIMSGILMLFIGYPVLSFIQEGERLKDVCQGDPMCIDVGDVPLLKNVRTGLIDPDTPKAAMTRRSSKGKMQNLVFSDEFAQPGRTFYEGDDPYWRAVDLWYGVTGDLEWYDPDAITTANGTLNIRFDAFQNHNLNYRSGMLQSWNQFCFKGGYIEASISLPGRGDTIGFWPGFWTMGNLGRPGYAATTEGMWPYSYEDVCDAGITPNQSDPSGLNFLPGMRLPACTCEGEDHPTPGRSRGAPEIDVVEASVTFLDPPTGNGIGSVSQSLQCAPFDIFWRPDYGFVELYDRSITTMNSYTGGVYQQAISGVSNLNNAWYNGKEFQTYAFEYEPGANGYVTWYVGGVKTWMLDGRAMGPNGNIGQRIVPEEPMALVLNFGMSNGWALLNLTGLNSLMPATMRFDYVRIYQDEGQEMVTCDPPGYETTEYIAKHPEPYNNANLTMWSHTPYRWPKNSLMNGCKAENYSNV